MKASSEELSADSKGRPAPQEFHEGPKRLNETRILTVLFNAFSAGRRPRQKRPGGDAPVGMPRWGCPGGDFMVGMPWLTCKLPKKFQIARALTWEA